MTSARYRLLRAAIVFAAIGIVGSHVVGASYAQTHKHPTLGASQRRPKLAKPIPASLDTIHSKQLPAIQEAVRKAIGRIEAGDSRAALAELKRIQGLLQAVHQALGWHIKPKFVNNRCPIMGSPIRGDKVPAQLTRAYKGQKVAFCCAGCPAAWDRLTEARKAAALKKVISSKTQQEHVHHPDK